MLQKFVDISLGRQSDREHKAPNIFDHVNFGLFFKNQDQNVLFQKFQEQQTFAFGTLLYMLVGTFYFLISRIPFLIYFPSWFATLNMIVCVFGVLVPAWTIVFIQYNSTTFLRKHISEIQCFWYFSCVSTFVLGVAFKAYNGVCDSDERNFLARFGCNSTKYEISEGYTALCLLLPTVLTLMVCGITWKNQLFTFTCSAIACFTIVYYYSFWDSQIYICMLTPFSFVVLYFNHVQQLKLYLLHEQQLLLLEENKLLAKEDHVTEMRHLIGNVAHDLKTPITGFLSGLETIATLTREALSGSNVKPSASTNSLHDAEGSNRDCSVKLQNVLNTVENVMHIHSFMLMTINRCVDFAKTSNGDALIPRSTTIDLSEVFNIPVACMSEMQDGVRVVAAEIPPSLCTHIVTDRQWLLDNLLCLLSNAVRYSEKGTEVYIRVSLCRDEPKKRQSAVNLQIEADRERTPKPKTVHQNRFSFLTSSTRVAASDYAPSPNRIDSNKTSHVTLDELELGLSTAAGSSSSLACDSIDQDCFLHFAVEDTGVGISSDLMESMFNPSFTQAHRQSGGTGLGLYSLAKRIEALGGDYGVHKRLSEKIESGQNQGSVFWFTIPYKPDKHAAAAEKAAVRVEKPLRRLKTQNSDVTFHMHQLTPSPSPHSQAPSQAPSRQHSSIKAQAVPIIKLKLSSSPLNILLVDDSLPILKMCGMLFRKQGHTLVTAVNGQEALERIEEENQKGCQFDVVLMDLQMPVMDGETATRRIRESERITAFNTASHSHDFDDQNDETIGDLTVFEIESSIKITQSSRKNKPLPTHENYPHLLIIGVSACGDDDTIQGAFTAGIDAFIPKPCTIKTFNETYDKHHKRLMEERSQQFVL